MLEIKDLCKSYGNFQAVRQLNLSIEDGTVFGFIGPNGAGKTTTMKIIAGLLPATSGSIMIQDEDIIKNPGLIFKNVGYMPDFFGIYDNLKVREYMDFYAGAYYIAYRDRTKIIMDLLELVDLTEKYDAFVDTLSRGMKQRLCLARSMIHDPSILILDEPASGLDPSSRIEMKEILKQLGQLGKTVLVSSHILTELAEMCTSIGIINHGQLVYAGKLSDIAKQMNKGRIIQAKVLAPDEMGRAVKLLSEYPEVSEITEKTDVIEFAYSGDDTALSSLFTQLVKKDIPLSGFNEKEGNIEDVFLQLTREVHSDDESHNS